MVFHVFQKGKDLIDTGKTCPRLPSGVETHLTRQSSEHTRRGPKDRPTLLQFWSMKKGQAILFN